MARAREQTQHATRTDNPPAALQAPRFAFGWASLVYLVCTFSLAWPALAGKFLVNPHSDQYIAGYAFREFAAATLRATGQFPLWNPYLFGGMPYVAAMHGDIFYPTFLLRLLLPTDVAMTWGFIIHLFLAGIFTFGLLKAIGYSFPGALAGGLAYMMGGQIASYVSPGHDGKLFVSALFPMALWILYRGIRGGRSSSWGAFALIVGLAVLSPHPQLLQYMLLACGAYALFLAFAKVDTATGALPRDIAVKRLAAALGAVVIGLAIGAVQYLPVREYVAWSPRAGGLANYETATSYAWRPEELLNTYLPQFSGILDAYWGRNFFHLHSDYVGAVVLVLAGAAFVGLRADPRRKHIIFWSAVLLVSVLWSLGSATPFYRIPYAIIPGTKYFRAPATIFFVGALAIAFLASAGTERFLQLRVTRKYLLGWLAFAGAIALLASASALTAIAASFAEGAQLDRLEANKSALIAGAWRSFAFVALTVGLGFTLLRQRIPTRYAGWGLVGLLVVDLWSIERLYWMFSPPASSIYASDEIVETIKAEPQPVRVLALRVPMQSDVFLTGDALMSHRVRGVLGYHGNQIGRYNELVGLYASDGRLVSPNVLQLTNTKFVLTNIPQIPFLPNTKLVKGPVRNASGEEAYLFRIDAEHPYAWVTPVAVKANDEQVLATLLDPRFDVRRAALFDNTADVSVADAVRALPEPLPIKASVRRYEPGKVDIEISGPAPKGATLMVSENYYPGWRARVDGKPARIGRADLSLIGVELPEGARRVGLEFTSQSYQTGKTITWIAIVTALLALAAGIWRDRRRLG